MRGCRPIRSDRTIRQILPDVVVAHQFQGARLVVFHVIEVTRPVAHHQLPLPLGHLENPDIEVLSQCYRVLRLVGVTS